MIEYKFNQKIQVLEVSYKGEITLSDLITYGENIKNDKSLPRDIKILTDATSANYQISPTDVEEMLKLLKEQVKPYKSVKSAVFHNKPHETAISYLVDNGKSIPNYKHKAFSSREAALYWLQYS